MRRVSSLFILFVLFVMSACAGTDVKTTPSGHIAPDFTLSNQDGRLWKLSDALKDYHAVVLAFYPKDDTKL